MEKTNLVKVGHHFNKHTAKNPLIQFIVGRYKKSLQSIVGSIQADYILEVGSGEGFIISYVLQITNPFLIVASDIDVQLMKENKKVIGPAKGIVCRGEELPFRENQFDLVIACEVLEHVSQPHLIMDEIRRVGKKWFVGSVPHEPWWRILNMMRLKYLRDLGNTPGHLQHWNLNGFVSFISKYATIHTVKNVFPWIFVVGKLY